MIPGWISRWFKIDWRIYKRPPITLAVLDEVLKEHYLPVIQAQLDQVPLFMQWATELSDEEKAERAAEAKRRNLEELGRQVKIVMERVYADSGSWPDEAAQHAIAVGLIWYEEHEVSHDW